MAKNLSILAIVLLGTGEGTLAELSNGNIYYNSRSHMSVDHRRRIAWSYDGGQTWRDLGFESDLPDGPRYRGTERRGSNYNGHFGMMCGLLRLPVERHDILIYSNADSPGHERVRMTVWASFDGGTSWPVKRLVFAGPSAYSSLSAGRSGTPSEGWIPDGRDGRRRDGALQPRLDPRGGRIHRRRSDPRLGEKLNRSGAPRSRRFASGRIPS